MSDPPPPFAPPPGKWRPVGAPRPPIRWGLPDVLIVWIVGTLVGAVASVPWTRVRSDGSVKLTAAAIVVALLAQGAAWVVAAAVVARRKGRGSLGRDFGWALPGPGVWGWFAAGLGLAFAVNAIVVAPLSQLAGGEEQAVADSLRHAHGPTFWCFALGVVVVAPAAEELIFRGILLRSLQRRAPVVWAVFGSGLVFGLAHVLGDPSVGSFVALPALVGLGVLNGVLAVRSGDLRRSMLVHAGFNGAAVLAILVGRL
ncbi:MAG: CPBP family intramembrane glutamic endopeptidase [Acidimicrobiia bacterium]